jgi:RND family efflux transporter MFP subunit
LRNERLSASMVAVIGAALVVSASSCSRAPGAAEVAEDNTRTIPTVAVAKASMENMSRSIVLTAEFKPFQEIDVMAKIAGYVKTIYVDVGDRVKQGQALALLEVPEMQDDQARAQSQLNRSDAEVKRAHDELQRAEAAHDLAHLSYSRLAEVAKQRAGLVAQQEIDDAHSKDLVAEAQVNAAKSALNAAEQQVQVNTAELQKIKTLSDYTRVTAPFAGVITKRYADTGSMIPAGTSSSTQAMPIVKLSENSLLRLVLPVPESAVPTVRVGQAVDVKVPTLNRVFPGRVARFADKVSVATRTMETEVDVQNPELVLIPGMYAEVELTLDRRDRVVAVPVSAVDFSGGEATGQVAVITPENHVEVRTVPLGLQTASEVEVRSGLRAGDLVVTGNRAALRDGEAVHPKVVELASKAP